MYIQLTTRCNMECNHCGFACGPVGNDISLAHFEQALAISAHDGEIVTLGGGEPTLHPQLWQFVGLTLATHPHEPPLIITNGKRTEIALKLAALAQRGVLAVKLSQDAYHEKIDQAVIKAFTRPPNNQYNNQNHHDFRGIHTVCTIYDHGRAKGWGEPDCLCNSLFCNPRGELFACGCQNHSFGTLDHPTIDYELLENLRDTNGCSTNWELQTA